MRIIYIRNTSQDIVLVNDITRAYNVDFNSQSKDLIVGLTRLIQCQDVECLSHDITLMSHRSQKRILAQLNPDLPYDGRLLCVGVVSVKVHIPKEVSLLLYQKMRYSSEFFEVAMVLTLDQWVTFPTLQRSLMNIDGHPVIKDDIV